MTDPRTKEGREELRDKFNSAEWGEIRRRGTSGEEWVVTCNYCAVENDECCPRCDRRLVLSFCDLADEQVAQIAALEAERDQAIRFHTDEYKNRIALEDERDRLRKAATDAGLAIMDAVLKINRSEEWTGGEPTFGTARLLGDLKVLASRLRALNRHECRDSGPGQVPREDPCGSRLPQMQEAPRMTPTPKERVDQAIERCGQLDCDQGPMLS